jgi:sorting nexin-17
VNGAHHCSVRYSQLNNLHVQVFGFHNLNIQFSQSQNFLKIKNEFAQAVQGLPLFPPKKVFSLSNEAKEERRQQLEKYLQQSIILLIDPTSSQLFKNLPAFSS